MDEVEPIQESQKAAIRSTGGARARAGRSVNMRQHQELEQEREGCKSGAELGATKQNSNSKI